MPSKNEILQDKIVYKNKSSWIPYNKDKKMVFDFSDKYKEFLHRSKTERLMIRNIRKELEKKGFKDITRIKTPGKDKKFFKEIKQKTIIAFVLGKTKDNFRIVGSHVDSPRLDLKPNPLYEDSGLSLLQTHYYGGLKKYHWVNTPLVLYGVIYTKKGKRIELSIGEKDSDPKFIIPDLLPHLSREQMERKAPKIIEGEELNILFGNMPIDDKKITEQVKLNVLKILNDKYGLCEEDFQVAELELVPLTKPMDIGIDRSMIAAYGQDDKVCAYTSLQALMQIDHPKNTAVGLFCDKEEIGSYGDTGASSYMLKTFAIDYVNFLGLKSSPDKILENSMALSADVTAAIDPSHKDVYDPFNSSYLGKGVSVEKYGGGGGKYSTHDAHAEYMQYLRSLMDKNKVPWQTGELGKVDHGGGGTIGMFMSRYGMDCADAGPCILGMHSPCEVTSKADIYSAYRLYKAFFMD